MSGEAYSVYYSPEAKDDLRAIYAYIAFSLYAQPTARAQASRIRKAIRSLSFLPERYTQVSWEPWHSQGVRKVPVDNYVIFYLVDEDARRVEVIRILYGGRNMEEIAQNIVE